jgi:hypothetical protein
MITNVLAAAAIANTMRPGAAQERRLVCCPIIDPAHPLPLLPPKRKPQPLSRQDKPRPPYTPSSSTLCVVTNRRANHNLTKAARQINEHHGRHRLPRRVGLAQIITAMVGPVRQYDRRMADDVPNDTKPDRLREVIEAAHADGYTCTGMVEDGAHEASGDGNPAHPRPGAR